MKWDVSLLLLRFIHFTVHDVYGWNKPSFISNWHPIESQNSENSSLTMIHSLGELPVKVDIQIKVVIDGVDYIFTGIGSAQRDNDDAHDYGGVVYIYNDVEVILSLPFGGADSGGVAYTGSHLEYNGPSSPVQGKHSNGFVRVKAWKQADFPIPLFEKAVKISDNETDSFKEINHQSSVFPDLVTAQTHLDGGYYSDGQGVIFQMTTLSTFNCLGGLMFGYSETKVRLWVPFQKPLNNNDCNGAVFFQHDGWGRNSLVSNNGTVVLKGYKLDENLAFETTVRVKDRISSQDIVYPSLYNIDHALVTVQVKHDENGGNNQGMIFDGAGSALSTTTKYSGVIYVYTNSSILLWTPSSHKGYMISINNRWGSGQMPSAETSADVIVRVYAVVECPDPSSSNSNYTISNGLRVGSVVTYYCDSGYIYTAGYLSRTCQSNRHWEGTDPICSQMQCLHPDGIANGTYVFTGKSIGDTVKYTCNVHYQYEAGDLERTCQLGGYWDGIPPVCSVIKCAHPGGVFKATYRVAGFAPGNTVTYTCVAGSMQQAGDSTRVCQLNGSWNGIPIVCYTAAAGPTNFNRVVYSPQELAESIKKTKKELTVDKKTTSSYTRTLVCATDSRPSSLYIGTVGIVLFSSMLAAVILPDIIIFIRHIWHMSNIYRRQ
ncbi:uncharacterized protein LOC134688071 [Mytilus trossulus]|uniref:uncharacterized protein LOC134688071 n=1 Tax=Mytilus trossulus TaxID=6551 RepID=UPI0030077489